MVVQHNLTAMNSNRMLGLTSKAQAKSTEKLSSGYKINRAADDASGLAISEKMRKQIRGLTQASANAQDGISAVQTAEGALAEVHDMLQRMNELAVKAANGTESSSDRSSIQAEIDQLTTEIDRVAETTKFNETYLLKGDKDATKGYTYSYGKMKQDYRGAGATATFTADTTTGLTAVFAAASTKDYNINAQNELIKALRDSGISITAESAWDKTAETPAAKATTYVVELNGAAKEKFDLVATSTPGMFDLYDKNGVKLGDITASGYAKTATADADYKDTVVLNATTVSAAMLSGGTAEYFDRDGNKIAANQLDNYFTATTKAADGKVTVQVKAGAPKVYDAVGNELQLHEKEVVATQDKMGTLSIGLHVGADATSNNQITMNIDAMTAKGLGIVGLKIDGTNDENALGAIEKISAALAKVSAQRGDLGAIQNRLEHTISNLDNVVENTTSAESAIRDTDMATEMVKYSNQNILSQAGQAMLAQANQSNQGVLSLLG